MMLFPKPEKPIRGTAAARRHMAEVAKQPCIVGGDDCEYLGRGVVVHHCIHDRFSGSRASDFDTIPLCWGHHDAQSPNGLHHAPETWRELHGPDHSHIPLVKATMQGAPK